MMMTGRTRFVAAFFGVAVLILVSAVSARGITIPEFREALRRQAQTSESGLRSQKDQLQFAVGMNVISDSNPKLQDDSTSFDPDVIIEELASIRFNRKWSRTASMLLEYEGHFRQYSSLSDLNNDEHIVQLGLKSDFGREDKTRRIAVTERFARLAEVLDLQQDAVASRNINELNPYMDASLGRDWVFRIGGLWRYLSYDDASLSDLNYNFYVPYAEMKWGALGKNIDVYARYESDLLRYQDSALKDYNENSAYLGLASAYKPGLKYDVRIGFSTLSVIDSGPGDKDSESNVSGRIKIDWSILAPNRSVLSAIVTRDYSPSYVSNFGMLNTAILKWKHIYDKKHTLQTEISVVYQQISRSIVGRDMALFGGNFSVYWWFHRNGSVFLSDEYRSRTSDITTDEYVRNRASLGLVFSY